MKISKQHLTYKFLMLLLIVFLGIRCGKDDGPQNPDPDVIENPDPKPDPTPEPENNPPTGLSLMTVLNNDVKVVPTPDFSWSEANDPDGDVVNYDLYLDRQPDPTTLIVENLTATSFQLPNDMALSLARQYYWKVIAKDGKGGQTISDTFTFKVKKLDDAIQLTSTTSFDPRSNHAAVVFNDLMYVLGGFSSGTFLNDSPSSANGDSWIEGLRQQNEEYEARFFHTATVFQDSIWITGGVVSDFVNDVWKSHDGTIWNNSLQEQEYLKRAEHTLTVHNDKIWIIAGNSTDGKLSDVWSSSNGKTWQLEVENAEFGKRNFHQTVSFMGKLWVIGGFDEQEAKNDIWSSEDGTSWQQVTANAEFSPRAFHRAMVFDDKIWIIGSGTENDIWYSEDGMQWVEVTPENSYEPKDGFTALFHQNKIWILGGSDTNDVWSIAYHQFE